MIANTTSQRQPHIKPQGWDGPFTSQRPGFATPGGGTSSTPKVHLTPRQLEVLALLCEGLPNKLICRRLSISAGTAKAHISSILRELCVSSRLQAVVEAGRHGLLRNQDGAGPAIDTPTGAPSVMPFKVPGSGTRTFDYAYS